MISTAIQVRSQEFVKTVALEQVMQRALRYLSSGYSVHLEGPTGIGKTTLALHLAECRSRPMTLILGGHDLSFQGKSEQPDSRLKVACCEGWTLVYDEFNRSRPDVNTMLLSALEERLLVVNDGYGAEYITVHPEFRVIFTSNSEEYCGTYSPQSALLDRLITIRLSEPNVLVQQQLLVERVGISKESAALVIGIVQQFFRQVCPERKSSLRPKLMIAQVCQCEGINVSVDDAEFRQVCRDILLARTSESARDANEVLWELFNRLSRRMAITNMETSPCSLEKIEYQAGTSIS